MTIQDEIKRGIAAHGMWKQRILDAIRTGQSEWTPAVVCQDNQCDFGKWLYSCSDADKASSHYEQVRELHAKFHKEAARVLEMALTGKGSEADQAVAMGSEYNSISTSLTKEMMAWMSGS